MYIEEVLHVILVVFGDGNVVFSIATRDAFAVDALDKHSLCFALHHLEILGLVFHRDLSHYLTALCFYFFRHLVGHDCGLCTSAHRVFESVDVAEADFFREVTAFFESLFGLAGEAYDDVGGEVEVGAEGLDALTHVTELGDSIKAVHPLQGVIGTAL